MDMTRETFQVKAQTSPVKRPLFPEMVKAGKGSGPGNNKRRFSKAKFYLDHPEWSLEDYAVNVQDAVRGATHATNFWSWTIVDVGDYWKWAFYIKDKDWEAQEFDPYAETDEEWDGDVEDGV